MGRIALAGWLLATATALFLAAPASGAQLSKVGDYTSPVLVTSDPTNPDRLFVVEREGRIH